jgi:hypothetical protein
MNQSKILIIATILEIVTLGALILKTPVSTSEGNSHSIPLKYPPINTENITNISSLEYNGIKDPETAAKYGIPGYIEITSTADTPKDIYLQESETNITLQLKFVSYKPVVTNCKCYCPEPVVVSS